MFGGTEDVAIADSIAADEGPGGEVMAMIVEDMITRATKVVRSTSLIYW